MTARPQSWMSAALGSITSSAGIAILGLLTGVIAARLLGAEGRGYLATVVTLTTLTVAVVQLPLSEAIVLASERLPKSAVLSATLAISLSFAALTLMPVLWFLHLRFADIPGLSWSAAAGFVAITLLAQALMQVYRGDLQQRRQFLQIQAYAVLQPFLYLLFLLAILAGAAKATVSAILLAQAASLLLTGLLRMVLSGTRLGLSVDGATLRAVMRLAGPLHVSHVVQTFSVQGDRLLVVSLLPAAQVGQFMVALAFATVLPSFFATAIRLLALPALMSFDPEKRPDQAVRLAALAWVAGLAGVGATALLAPVMVPLLFGAEFASAVMLAILLSATTALSGVRVSLLEVQKSLEVSASLMIASLVFIAVLLAASMSLFSLLGVFAIILARGAAEIATVAYLSWKISRLDPRVGVGAWIVPNRGDLGLIARAALARFQGGTAP